MDQGLFIDRSIQLRYRWEQQLVAAAILEGYHTHHDGQGSHILVPTHEILTNLGLAITPANIVDLRDIAYAMFHRQKIAHRIDERFVELWLPPEVVARARHYQRMPRPG